MKIGIIGSGQIGGALTRRLTQLGQAVAVVNSRDPDSLAELAAETGARAVSPAAKATVLRLVDELGIDGVDAGGLDDFRRQQPGTSVYAKDCDAAGVRRALAAANRERMAEWRGTPASPGSFAAPA